MTLLSKLARLEKIATAQGQGRALEPSPELVAEIQRSLAEATADEAAWRRMTLHEKIADLREQIKRNEARKDNETDDDSFPLPSIKPLLDRVLRAELAQLEAEAAKPQ